MSRRKDGKPSSRKGKAAGKPSPVAGRKVPSLRRPRGARREVPKDVCPPHKPLDVFNQATQKMGKRCGKCHEWLS